MQRYGERSCGANKASLALSEGAAAHGEQISKLSQNISGDNCGRQAIHQCGCKMQGAARSNRQAPVSFFDTLTPLSPCRGLQLRFSHHAALSVHTRPSTPHHQPPPRPGCLANLSPFPLQPHRAQPRLITVVCLLLWFLRSRIPILVSPHRLVLASRSLFTLSKQQPSTPQIQPRSHTVAFHLMPSRLCNNVAPIPHKEA